MENKHDYSTQFKELAAKNEDVYLEQVYVNLGDPKTAAIYSTQLYIPISGNEVRVIWHTSNKFEEVVHFRARYDLVFDTDFDLVFRTAKEAYDFARLTAAIINAAWAYNEDCLYWAFRELLGGGALIGGGKTGLSPETERKIAEKVDDWICETAQDADDPERGYDYAVKDLTDDERRFFDVVYEWDKRSGGRFL